jgi:hypothetical protein
VDDNIIVAQEGEGIYEVLLRNELLPKVHKKAFLELNAQRLDGDTLLLAGKTYELPEKIEVPLPKKEVKKPTSYRYPVFGKKYEAIPIIDNQLDGAI